MTSPLEATATPAPTIAAVDMRLAQCGGAQVPGWQLGWAQVVGVHHPRFTEDSVAHASRLVAGGMAGTPQPAVLAVSDGVGGGSHGEVASGALVQHCINIPPELLGHAGGIRQWMELAEAQVQLKLREVSLAPGAATLAAAWLLPAGGAAEAGTGGAAHGYLLRVGDARVYCFDGTQTQALTADQTYASLGEPTPRGATPDDPARMVGTGYMGSPELVPVQLTPDQTLLLCSDGLHRGLTTEHMSDVLRQGKSLEAAALSLAQAARWQGSEDDITVLLARPEPLPGSAGEAEAPAASPVSTVLRWLGLSASEPG